MRAAKLREKGRSSTPITISVRMELMAMSILLTEAIIIRNLPMMLLVFLWITLIMVLPVAQARIMQKCYPEATGHSLTKAFFLLLPTQTMQSPDKIFIMAISPG
jgi:hypothetical protein